MKKSLIVVSKLIAAVGFASVGMSCFAQGSDKWESEILAAARQEGKVVIYNGSSPGLTDVVAKAFTDKYGIAIERLDARPVEVRERIRTEQSAGRFVGDITISITETLKLQNTTGVLQPHGALPSLARVRDDLAGEGTVLPFAMVRWAILLNNRLVPPGQEPRTWSDLLDPKWKGKILMDDPRTNGGGYFLFSATYKAFGRDFHERLAAQKPVLSSNVSLNERRVVQGEYALYLPQVVPNLSRLKGLPIRAISPEEGLPYGVSGAAMLTKAPHPNAARLFMEFLLSDEGQEAVATRGYGSVTGLVSKKLPPALSQLVQAPLLGTASSADADKMLKLAAEIYR